MPSFKKKLGSLAPSTYVLRPDAWSDWLTANRRFNGNLPRQC
jgi:hypothetical protein